MTYIPKKTLHIRHENLHDGATNTYCLGRWIFADDDAEIANFASYTPNVGDSNAFANLTGTREKSGNIEFLRTNGGYWHSQGLPAGEYTLEYESVRRLLDTSNPHEFYLYTWGGNNTLYDPPLGSLSSTLNSRYHTHTWTDYTESGDPWRITRMKLHFTCGNPYGNSFANLQFREKTNRKTDIIRYEDIKIVKLN